MSDLFDWSGTFTRNAWEWLYQTVDHEQFGDRDTELIYESLEKDFQPTHFGRYLQHYIFKKTGMQGVYTNVPLKDYQTIIQDAFRDNGTPASFTPTTSKLSALTKNWLTQQSVKRQAVLLLGFGLRMSEEEVDDFLYKALHEPILNDLNPFETICAYCYQHGYGYYKFQQLWKAYESMAPDQLDMKPVYDAQPAGRKESYATIYDDSKLLSSLAGLKKNAGSKYADTVYLHFLTLYNQARDLTAAQLSETGWEEALLMGRRLRENLERSSRYDDFEKEERVRRVENSGTTLTRDDITESTLEDILCSAIPTDRSGNLIPARRSTLNALFEGKRMSRQHLSDLLLRKTEPERFDLITLNFLIFSLRVEEEPNAQKRYMRFIKSTNQILADCYMGPLYVTNPYESFVLMCMLSVSPLETYNDVIEKSYHAEK